MIQTLKDWFSKRAKKSAPDIEEENSVAFFNLAVDAEHGLTITADYIDGNESAMAHLVFLLCSGSLMELVGGIIEQRCGEDTEKRDAILSEAYQLIMQNITQSMNTTEDSEDDDDNEPVVDPCNVFNPKMNNEMSEDSD